MVLCLPGTQDKAGGMRTLRQLLAAFRAGCHFNDDRESAASEAWRYRIPSVGGALPRAALHRLPPALHVADPADRAGTRCA